MTRSGWYELCRSFIVVTFGFGIGTVCGLNSAVKIGPKYWPYQIGIWLVILFFIAVFHFCFYRKSNSPRAEEPVYGSQQAAEQYLLDVGLSTSPPPDVLRASLRLEEPTDG